MKNKIKIQHLNTISNLISNRRNKTKTPKRQAAVNKKYKQVTKLKSSVTNKEAPSPGMAIHCCCLERITLGLENAIRETEGDV